MTHQLLPVLQLSVEELETLERERAAQRMELYLEHERFQTEQRQRHLARQSRKAGYLSVLSANIHSKMS